jgi:pimeloyl-ACP methyl ester carboxylesterase
MSSNAQEEQVAACRVGWNFTLFATLLFSVLPLTALHADSAKSANLVEAITLPLGERQVLLAKGTLVQVLNQDSRNATVNLQLPDGSPMITQIPLSKLEFLFTPIATASSGTSPASPAAAAPVVQSPLSEQTMTVDPAPQKKTSSDSGFQNPLDPKNNAIEALPAFSHALESLDASLPPKRYTALNGYFYVLIDGTAVPVVYSLPMENQHLAKSASNLIFYGPYPNEQTKLNGNIVPKIVENLGCSVFSLSFKQHGLDLADPKTAYWDKDSPWFPAVLSARDEIIKGFGLERKKLILMGYSGGGGMVLNLAGAYPGDIEAVAAQGANLAPDLSEKNDIKWFIINNRGESNAVVTVPFYDHLQTLGCTALYCETTPERGRGHYHSPSAEGYDLVYSFIAGILTQRDLEAAGTTDLPHLWPYVAPKDPLKRYAIAKTVDLDDSLIKSGSFDLLPSAPFASNWSRVCAPTQTVKPENGLASLHITFPACRKPIATILYYSNPGFEDISRIVEDVNSLAEHGYIVISPAGMIRPEAFATSAVTWIGSQGSYAGGRIHLLGYGQSGASFISAMTQCADPNVSIQSISLADFDDSTVDVDVRANIETLAKSCGMYGFFVCSNSPPSTTIAGLANDLVTTSSEGRGCSKLFITRKMTQDVINLDQAKVSADVASLGADGNQVALDNDQGLASSKSPKDQDQALADQELLDLDQEQLVADQNVGKQDLRQADNEEKQVEDQALIMVKTLIDRTARS